MENNTAKKEFLDACRGLVMNCDCKILVVEIMGEFRAYVAPEVRLKTRECRYNEVRDAQEVTSLLANIGHNFASGMTEQRLRERIQSVNKEDFKFGTDNYFWITKVSLNQG